MFVTDITATAYRFVFSNLKTFFVFGALPIVILTGLFVLQDLPLGKGNSGVYLGQAIVEAWFALLWHRHYLLGIEPSWFRGIPSDSSKAENEAYDKLGKKFMLGSVGLSLAISFVLAIVFLPLIFSNVACKPS